MDFFLPELKCLVSAYVVNLRNLVPTKSSVLFKTELHWKTLHSILFTCKASNPKLHYLLTSYSKFQSLLVEIGWDRDVLFCSAFVIFLGQRYQNSAFIKARTVLFCNVVLPERHGKYKQLLRIFLCWWNQEVLLYKHDTLKSMLPSRGIREALLHC